MKTTASCGIPLPVWTPDNIPVKCQLPVGCCCQDERSSNEERKKIARLTTRAKGTNFLANYLSI